MGTAASSSLKRSKNLARCQVLMVLRTSGLVNRLNAVILIGLSQVPIGNRDIPGARLPSGFAQARLSAKAPVILVCSIRGATAWFRAIWIPSSTTQAKGHAVAGRCTGDMHDYLSVPGRFRGLKSMVSLGGCLLLLPLWAT